MSRNTKRLDRQKRKNGVNPVTGETLDRRTARKGRKHGFNDDGSVNSRQQTKSRNKDRKLDNKAAKIDSKAVMRENRTLGRLAKKTGKGNKKTSEGLATELLAEQGIDSQAAQKEALGNAFSQSIGSLTAAFTGAEPPEATFNEPTFSTKEAEFDDVEYQEEEKQSTPILKYLLLAAGAFLLLKVLKIIK